MLQCVLIISKKNSGWIPNSRFQKFSSCTFPDWAELPWNMLMESKSKWAFFTFSDLSCFHAMFFNVFFFKLLYFIYIYTTHKIFSLAKSFEFLPTPQRTWQLFPSVKIFCYYARFWLKKSFRWQETRDMSQKVTSLMNLTFSCIDEFVISWIQIHTFALY